MNRIYTVGWAYHEDRWVFVAWFQTAAGLISQGWVE